MNTHTHTHIALLSATALIAALSAQGNLTVAAERSATITSRSAGFISPSTRRAPGIYGDHEAGFVDALCAVMKRKTGNRCPPTLRGPTGRFSDTLSAGLPNLRLTIVLREISHVVVSGSGVDFSGMQYAVPQGYIAITSPMVSDDYNGGNWWFVPLPMPGETWSQMNDATGLFTGLIVNGCAGAAATFDLHLQSTIYVDGGLIGTPSDTGTIGSINVDDSVTGPGYYNFKYTIRATDPYGNVSDFTFSGDADSLCTASS